MAQATSVAELEVLAARATFLFATEEADFAKVDVLEALPAAAEEATGEDLEAAGEDLAAAEEAAVEDLTVLVDMVLGAAELLVLGAVEPEVVATGEPVTVMVVA